MGPAGEIDLARQLWEEFARETLGQLASQLVKLAVPAEDCCGWEGGVFPGHLNLVHLCRGP